MDDLQRWYCSQATGKLKKTLAQVVFQMFESLFHYGFLDFRWKVVWC